MDAQKADVPSEVAVLRREVAILLHEKLNAHIEPATIDKYTFGVDLNVIDDLYSVISQLRSHILTVEARVSEQVETNTKALTVDYQRFNYLLEQAKQEIGTLTTKVRESEARIAGYAFLDDVSSSQIQSLEVRMMAREELAQAVERTYKDMYRKLAEKYTASQQAIRKLAKRIDCLTSENTALRMNNRRLVNELAVLITDCTAASERANQTLSIYGSVGQKLNTLLDTCLSKIVAEENEKKQLSETLESIVCAVDQVKDEVDNTVKDMQQTISDQEIIIANLTKELDELSTKDLDTSILQDKIAFLEEENRKLLADINSRQRTEEKAQVAAVNIDCINEYIRSFIDK